MTVTRSFRAHACVLFSAESHHDHHVASKVKSITQPLSSQIWWAHIPGGARMLLSTYSVCSLFNYPPDFKSTTSRRETYTAYVLHTAHIAHTAHTAHTKHTGNTSHAAHTMYTSYKAHITHKAHGAHTAHTSRITYTWYGTHIAYSM